MIASTYTRVAAGASATNIESGQTINVCGIVCANVSGSPETVTIADADGNTIQTLRCSANASEDLSFCWYARAGLQITPGDNTSVTVYHSKGGA